jgi:hypothetical protein
VQSGCSDAIIAHGGDRYGASAVCQALWQ